MYRTAMAVCRPVTLWGRLQAEGWRRCRRAGRCWWSATTTATGTRSMVGVSAIRRRQIKALAKSDLWEVRGLAPVLNGMGQIPIERGAGDAGALARAIEDCAGRLHRRLPRRDPLARQSAAGAQRRRPPRARGPRGEARLRRDRGDLGPDRLPPASAAADPLLRARGGQAQPARRRESSRSGCWPRSASSSHPRSPRASAPSSALGLFAAGLAARTTRRRRRRSRCPWRRRASCRPRRCRAGGRRR